MFVRNRVRRLFFHPFVHSSSRSSIVKTEKREKKRGRDYLDDFQHLTDRKESEFSEALLTGCAFAIALPPGSVLIRANGRKELSVRT